MRREGLTDRQADMAKLIVNFRNCANAPRNNGQTYNCADLKQLKNVLETKQITAKALQTTE